MATCVLVVGAGSIGRRHAENLTVLGAKAELLGWRQTSANAVADRLAKGGVDGLVIATATQVRLPLIEAAAAAGIPFYVEKPLAFTSEGLQAMLSAALPVSGRSMVGFMMRYHPAFRDLAQADLSDAFRFDLAIGHDVTQWRQNWLFSQSYAAKAAGGGVLLDLCHEVDMAACLFPGLTLGPVHSIGHPSFPGVDMASRIAVSAPSGATGSIAMDYLAPRLVRDIRICGTTQTRSYDFAAQSYSVSDAERVSFRAHPLERNQMFLSCMRDFLALVDGRRVSDVEHLPLLSDISESCALIAGAWEKRRFIGQTAKDIP